MRTFYSREILESLEEVINPRHTALIILDATNDFLSPQGKHYNPAAPATPAVMALVPRIGTMLECARRNRSRLSLVSSAIWAPLKPIKNQSSNWHHCRGVRYNDRRRGSQSYRHVAHRSPTIGG